MIPEILRTEIVDQIISIESYIDLIKDTNKQ